VTKKTLLHDLFSLFFLHSRDFSFSDVRVSFFVVAGTPRETEEGDGAR
jgi:hypothetical protein